MGLNASSVFFFILALSSAALVWVVWWKLKCQRLEGIKPPIYWDLLLYILAVVCVFGVAGFGLGFAPDYYQNLLEHRFLSQPADSTAITGVGDATQKAGIAEPDTDFGAGDFLAFLGILTGIPVALAGSVYAIMLARRADETAVENMEFDLERRLDELTHTITCNFTNFANALLETNAAAICLFERSFGLCGRVIREEKSAPTLAQCAEVLETGELIQLKEKIRNLRDAVANILRHDPSADALKMMLENRKHELAASHFSDPEKYTRAHTWSWLTYGKGEFDHVIDPLELIRVQAERLSGSDVITGTLETALTGVNEDVLNENDVAANALSPDLLFSAYYRHHEPTRLREESYYLRALGRVLLTREIRKIDQNRFYKSRMVNFGAVILEDLYRLVPDKQVIENSVRKQSIGARIERINSRINKEHFESLSYAGEALFPAYFRDAVLNSLKADIQGREESMLILRLPKFVGEITRLVADGVEDQTDFVGKWKSLYVRYIVSLLVEDVEDPSSKGAIHHHWDSLAKTLEQVEESLDTALRAEAWRACTLSACSSGEPETARAYAMKALTCVAEQPELKHRCLLDLGDLNMAIGDTQQAQYYYGQASDTGRPNSIGQFSIWLEGLLRKQPFGFIVQEHALSADEVAADYGLLPFFCSMLPLSGISFRQAEKTVLGVKAEFLGTYRFPEFVELWKLFAEILQTLPANEGKAGNNRRLDEILDTEWIKKFEEGVIVMLPAE